MSAYSTPRPTCRVRCVPSRSSSSVRGSRRVDCGGATGNTNTSATADGRRSRPADRRTPWRSTRTVTGIPAPALGRHRRRCSRPGCPSTTSTSAPDHRPPARRSTAVVVAVVAQTRQRHLLALEAAQQLRFGVHARRPAVGRCQRTDTSTPSSGAAKATSCHRDPSTATASATTAAGRHRAGQRRWPPAQFDVAAADDRSRGSAGPRNRETTQQLLDDVGAAHLP